MESDQPVEVVVPAYNEQEAITTAVEEIHRDIIARLPGSRLIVVDDGSTDDTPLILAELAARLPGLEVLRKPNGGHGPAVLHGMAHCRGPWIFLIDADRQQDPADFWRLWPLRRGKALVMGRRQNRGEGPARDAVSAGLRLWGRLLFGKCPPDPNVPFKLVSRELWLRARPLLGPRCEVPSAALALLAAHWRLPLAQAPVSHRPRQGGKTVLIGRRLLGLCLRAALELVRLRRLA